VSVEEHGWLTAGRRALIRRNLIQKLICSFSQCVPKNKFSMFSHTGLTHHTRYVFLDFLFMVHVSNGSIVNMQRGRTCSWFLRISYCVADICGYRRLINNREAQPSTYLLWYSGYDTIYIYIYLLHHQYLTQGIVA